MIATVKRLMIVALVCVPAFARAQAPAPPNPEAKREAMARLDFLVGEWAGSGWVAMGPGERTEYSQTESVKKMIDGQVLLVEGVGRSQDADAKVVHHAVAIMAYDPDLKVYRVSAHTAEGRSTEATASFTDDGAFRWGFNVGGPREVRYTIRLSDTGEWVETGEFSMDGASWRQFLEMKLKRVE